jgi:NADP-dependent 3-hydroxy acid dehydrogenase YdfG
MTTAKIAGRVFENPDQQRFSSLSGDVNPMHMDALVARRTQAGAQVVHGVHAFLWAVEHWCAQEGANRTIITASTRFKKFLLMGRPVAVLVAKHDERSAKLSVTCDDLEVMTVSLKFGTRKTANLPDLFESLAEKDTSSDADVRSFDQMTGVSGWLTPPASNEEISIAFPNCCEALSVQRVAAIMQLSTLVGMHNPGEHSVFSSFAIDCVDGMTERAGVGFQTTGADERFCLVSLEVAGSGIQGTVEAFARQEPVASPSVASLTGRVYADEFSEVSALIVGGSRGLGAVTAKLLATGGGRSVITYARGRNDAHQVAADINERCGEGICQTLQYDAKLPAASQIEAIADSITDLYYFATPQIFRQKKNFSESQLHDFISIYVGGFHSICSALISRFPDSMRRAFYPSSVSVDERPKEMLEYSMAKVVGEMLCNEIDQSNPNLQVHISRIPRTTTDQTATIVPVESADPIEVMIPVLRKMIR